MKRTSGGSRTAGRGGRTPRGPLGSAALPAALLVLAGCAGGGRKGPRPLPVPEAPRAAKASEPKPEPPPAPPPLELELRRPDPKAREAFRTSFAEGGERARDLEPASAPPKVTALALENTARGEAAGMRPDGALRSAELEKGGRASVAMRLARGRCLTVIAQGGLGAVEVDLFLTSGEGSRRRIVAEDGRTGPIAVIGGRPGCFRVPAEGLYELHALLRRGEGPVLVRAYEQEPAGERPSDRPEATPPPTPASKNPPKDPPRKGPGRGPR